MALSSDVRVEGERGWKKNKDCYYSFFFQNAAGALGVLGIPVRASEKQYKVCNGHLLSREGPAHSCARGSLFKLRRLSMSSSPTSMSSSPTSTSSSSFVPGSPAGSNEDDLTPENSEEEAEAALSTSAVIIVHLTKDNQVMKIAADIADLQRVVVQRNTITLCGLRKQVRAPAGRYVCDIAEDEEEEEEEEEDEGKKEEVWCKVRDELSNVAGVSKAWKTELVSVESTAQLRQALGDSECIPSEALMAGAAAALARERNSAQNDSVDFDDEAACAVLDLPENTSLSAARTHDGRSPASRRGTIQGDRLRHASAP